MDQAVDTVVTAISFRGVHAARTIKDLRQGERIELKAEPENRWDNNAIQCHARGVWIGYIPRVANPRIAIALAEGLPVVATVTEPAGAKGDFIFREPKIRVAW